MTRRTLFLLTILLCCSTLSLPAHAKSRAAREDDIREVVFRRIAPRLILANAEQLSSFNTKKGLPPVRFYYFSYWGHNRRVDPSSQFLKRFAGYNLLVKKRSESYIDRQSKHWMWSAVRDKKTKFAGQRFDVLPVRWLSRTHVVVRGVFFSGGENAAGALYWLKFNYGHWRIYRVTDSVIS